MSQLKDQQTGASGDNFTVGGNLAVTGTAEVTGVLTAPTATAGTNTTQVATTAFVNSNTLKDPTANGIVTRTSLNTTINRIITASTGITVTDGDGVSGNPTISNSGVLTVNGSSGAVTINQLTSGTAVTASGTSVNFTGIPSWVKRITVMINGLSYAAAGAGGIQIGSGSLTTTGYTSNTASVVNAGATVVNAQTTTFGRLDTASAAQTHNGMFIITNITGNTWSFISSHQRSDLIGITGSGFIALGGVLDRLSVVATTSSFDAGTVNIMWE